MTSRPAYYVVFAGIGLAIFFLGTLIDSFAATDFSPPKTTVSVVGNYNNVTGWYYGNAPMARFTATDDLSGVKHIAVWYKTFDKKCSNRECLLQSGDSIKLDKQTGLNKGTIIVYYFAIDNEGNAEGVQKLSIRADTTPPDLYVTKIRTESTKSIPIGSNCKNSSKAYNCVIINAKIKENVTFEMLGSDSISGLKNIYYHASTKLSDKVVWHTVDKAIPHTLNLHFEKAGMYSVQFKATDKAGNESKVKEFLIKVS